MGVTSINDNNNFNISNVSNYIPFMKIALNKQAFYPSERVTGEVIIVPTIDVFFTAILLKMEVHEKWIYVESGDSTISETHDFIILQRQLLQQNPNNQLSQVYSMIAGNRYTFPIDFELHKNLIPSFDFPYPNRIAYVRYSLNAEVIGQVKCPVANENIIIKSRPLVLAEPLNYSSCINVHTWGLIENGTTILSANYTTNNYKYGDKVSIMVNVNNMRGNLNVVMIKLQLQREIKLLNLLKEVKYTWTKCLKKSEFFYNCPKISKRNEVIVFELRDDDENNINWDIPYANLEGSLSNLMGSIKSVLIECSYSIKITCYFESNVGYNSRPRVILPLSITAQLNDEFQLEQKEAEDMTNAIKESKIEFDSIEDNKKIQEVEELNNALLMSQIEYESMQEKKKQELIEEEFINDRIEQLEKNLPMQMSVIDNGNHKYHANANDYPLQQSNKSNNNDNQQMNYPQYQPQLQLQQQGQFQNAQFMQPQSQKQQPVDMGAPDFIDINAL